MDEHLMRIGEIAAFFGVSVKAMRVYERMGIITPVKIDEQTGYRYYSADQVKYLSTLLELKSLGFTLAEVRRLLQGGMDKDIFMEALVHKQAKWQDAISSAENKIHAMEKIKERLSTTKPAAKLHELTEEERAWLLVKMVCVEQIGTDHILSEAIWL